MGKREADANARPETRWEDEGGLVSPPSDDNVERLHDEVESALHNLETAVAELDRRTSWRNALVAVRRGPWILAGVGVLVAGLILRRRGQNLREPARSPGRAVAAGGIALLGLLAKRWAKRLWAGRA